MRKDRGAPRGAVHRLALESRVLSSNMFGDSCLRDVDIYVPANSDGAGLPLLVDLVGFTAGGPAHTSWKNFAENLPERLDRLIATGVMPPCVVVFPDCFTRLGGNQYINSIATGRWDDFLLLEMVPFVEAKFRCGGFGKRGVFGKSSGGYGAMVHALLHPDFWSAAAVHSGDMGFEQLFFADFPKLLRALAKHGGSIEKWIAAFEGAIKTKEEDILLLMDLAMAAEYDPDPQAFLGIRLPVDPHTCELIPERWANWKKWDPLSLVEVHGAGLKRLKSLYIDCGDIDQFNLVYGARRMHDRLTELGIDHTYEEFADNHSAIDYRMDRSLPIIAKALAS
jgi:S-formylglutathione hydrolase FrmB